MILKEYIKKCELSFDDEFYERCDIFIQLLQKWGSVHSFTTQLSQKEIIENIVDSIFPLNFIDDFKSFADIGTGAGYPGMLMAIAKPKIKCYLIEPRLKRVAFLNFVKNRLNLKNVEVIQSRVENCKNIKVELIISRAVTDTKMLIDLTNKIINDDTKYLFYKGSMCEDEILRVKMKAYQIVNRTDTRNYLYIKEL